MRIDIFRVGAVQTNCYLAYDEETLDAFIVDPGDDAGRLLRAIGERGLSLRYIILTHGHFDHVLAVPELLRQTEAQLVAAKNARLDDAEACGFRAFRIAQFTPLCADILVSEGETLLAAGETLRFYETPGHTPGGICIQAGEVLFTGDTLFAGSCGRCDLSGGDYSVILKSLRKLAELPGDFRVLPGHGEATMLSTEREQNPYMCEATR